MVRSFGADCVLLSIGSSGYAFFLFFCGVISRRKKLWPLFTMDWCCLHDVSMDVWLPIELNDTEWCGGQGDPFNSKRRHESIGAYYTPPTPVVVVCLPETTTQQQW
jgi:hypothetical protein